jgi:hypothetical protein
MRSLPATDSAVQLVLDGDTVDWSANGVKSGDFIWHKVFHHASQKNGYMAELPDYKVVPIADDNPPNELDKAALLALVEDAKADIRESQNAISRAYETLKQIEDALDE